MDPRHRVLGLGGARIADGPGLHRFALHCEPINRGIVDRLRLRLRRRHATGRHGRALGVVETAGVVTRGARTGRVAGEVAQLGERDAGVGMIQHQVGRRRDLHGLTSERDAGLGISSGREDLGLRDPPGDRGLEVLTCERLALGGHQLRLVDLALLEQRGREQRGGLTRVCTHAEGVETLVRGAQRRDRRRRVTRDQLHHAGEQIRLEQPVAQTQLLEARPGRREHRPGHVDAAPQRFEHRLAAHRGRLDGR